MMNSLYSITKVYTQKFTQRNWSVSKPNAALRLLHKVTFGKYGEIPMVDFYENDKVLYSTQSPEEMELSMSLDREMKDLGFNKSKPEHIKCRYSMPRI